MKAFLHLFVAILSVIVSLWLSNVVFDKGKDDKDIDDESSESSRCCSLDNVTCLESFYSFCHDDEMNCNTCGGWMAPMSLKEKAEKSNIHHVDNRELGSIFYPGIRRRTQSPTVTQSPSTGPTRDPTSPPTLYPTSEPTWRPIQKFQNPPKATPSPTNEPTLAPTVNPTRPPTFLPTTMPTNDPTIRPTSDPSSEPTNEPTLKPTTIPTNDPTSTPTSSPSSGPTNSPSPEPTSSPTSRPTSSPTDGPTSSPTSSPTLNPTSQPTFLPTSIPTDPTIRRTFDPSPQPTRRPTPRPTAVPTIAPTLGPSGVVDCSDFEKVIFFFGPMALDTNSGGTLDSDLPSTCTNPKSSPEVTGRGSSYNFMRYFATSGEKGDGFTITAPGTVCVRVSVSIGFCPPGELILAAYERNQLKTSDLSNGYLADSAPLTSASQEFSFLASSGNEYDLVLFQTSTFTDVICDLRVNVEHGAQHCALELTSIVVEETTADTPITTSQPTSLPTTSPVKNVFVKDTKSPVVEQEAGVNSCGTVENKDGKAVMFPFSGSSGDLVFLKRSDQLCTLWQVQPETQQLIPVGRSYEGNAWEPYGGKLSHLTFTCNSSSCSTTLPDLPENYRYELVGFDYELPRHDEVARFLESATFGPTREDIEAFPSNYGSWIQQQQALPLTSHRQYFRERLTTRYQSPSSRAVTTHPCQRGARYRRYALVESDFLQELEISTDAGTGNRILLRDGEVITVLNGSVLSPLGRSASLIGDGFYKICEIDTSNGLEGRLRIDVPGFSCTDIELDGERLYNPPVYFDAGIQPTRPPLSLDFRVNKLSEQELFLANDLNDANCDNIPPARYKDKQVVIGNLSGQHWLFDPQIVLQENSLETPLPDGGGNLVQQTRLTETELENDRRGRNYEVLCSNAVVSFVNLAACKLSYQPDTCTQQDPPDMWLTMKDETLLKFHEIDRYLYAVEGLRQEKPQIPYGSPCTAGETSRWIPSSCSGPTVTISSETNQLFAELLRASTDTRNPFVRDITFPLTGSSCNANDRDSFDFKVNVNGECWLNVHKSHLQVYDFTPWVDEHPGGAESITRFAGGAYLTFPDWHGMDRWHGVSQDFRTEVGRYGDEINFANFPMALATQEVAESLGLYKALQAAGPAVICGTPFESPNILSTAAKSFKGAFGFRDRDRPEQKKQVWFDIALNRKDQLRQKVAWILSQILVISPNSIPGDLPESWTAYYDIFVRHAFGNYRDILKEVSFSPMMATMLTYMGNKGTDYFWTARQQIGFADENYAREIMQLFSIGLLKMNNDGTLKQDEDGKPVPTYTNSEIIEYARAWTGLNWAGARGNIETRFASNYIDTLLLEVSWRDSFPKLGLDGVYVGDHIPLCSSLPEQHFLQKGATYILLGSFSRPHYHSEPSWWSTNGDTVRTQLGTNSALYTALCDRDSKSGNCKYPPKVVLDSKLECVGEECDMESARLVEVGSGIFYEYVRMPCSHQAFFSDGHAIATKTSGRWVTYACGDSKTAVAQVGCCSWDGSKIRLSPTFGHYHGERWTWQAAKELCEESGFEVCTEEHTECVDCNWHKDYWVDHSCSQQVKITLDGRIGLVHSFQDIETPTFPSTRADTKTFFGVIWSTPESIDMASLLSDYDEFCSSLGCPRDDYDNLCLCPAQVVERVALNEAPTREQVLEELFVGAFDPNEFWGLHSVSNLDDGVKMHSFDEDFTSESVFEVIDDNGVTRFRKNVRSDVIIGVGSSSGLQISFRNPSHIATIHDPDIRDAFHETDAVLDHYFYHSNTAPFLALRFAQRFGLSNPSPRLIDIAATSFRDGFYSASGGVAFGSRQYGDLGAMVAALLLDREARSVILDADPSHGSLQEPFLRLVRTMRSLEFQLKPDDFFIPLRKDLFDLIGQAPHELPTVFSFFLPEYQPQGPVGDGGLVCPECQVLAGPKAVDMVNGLVSLIKYGMDTAYGGFSSNSAVPGGQNNREVGEHLYAIGFNHYSPTKGLDAAGVVDELATLLTSGRLSSESRALLQSVYESHSGPEAYIHVQQIISTSPEFHTNGISRSTGETRPEVEPPGSSSLPYKAVLHILMNGGMDTFNILVPAECSGMNAAGQTVDKQYQSIRGEIGIKLSETPLRISVDPSLGQPCSSFAIHPQASVFKELYDEGSLVFFANVGSFNSAEMNKSNFRNYASPYLFAHNGMQEEVKAVDPFEQEAGTGILGRTSNALNARGISAAGISINQFSSSLDGLANSRVVSQNGSTRFNDRPSKENSFELSDFASQLNGEPELYSSLFGKTWSSVFTSGVADGDFLSDALAKTTLESNQIDSRFGTVARLIQTKDDRGVDRDLFHVEDYGWDHHSNLKSNQEEKLRALDKNLKLFVEQLKSQGVWENTVVVITSDFGRTLTPNGMDGSDHAWGGNYMVFGGGVKGGQILGQYPYDLTETGPVNLGYGRGSIMPTTAWESVWNGIVQWMGVETTEEIEYVLPNLNNVYGGDFFGPFSEADIFK